MSEEMNNLKVLGLIHEEKGNEDFYDNFDEFLESGDGWGTHEYNTLLVEDVKNKAQYYIHLDNYKTHDSNLPEFYIEPAKEEKTMTHLPKDETYIEGFAINPKTLNYTYNIPKEEDIYENPNDPDLIPDRNDFEDTIVNNVFSCRLKEGLNIKSYLRVNENLFVPNPDLQTNKMSKSNVEQLNFEKLRYKMQRKDLLKQATLVEVDNGLDVNVSNHITLLCKTMVDAAKTGPVKAEYVGKMFVVDKGASREQVLQAWKEQAWKPYLMENFNSETLINGFISSKEPDLSSSANSYRDAAVTEILVTKYPEHADKLSMLQLLNAVKKSTRENVDIIAKALLQNVNRFIKGEETFQPTLKNMKTLEENKDYLTLILGVAVKKAELEKRIQESEQKILDNTQTPKQKSNNASNIIKVLHDSCMKQNPPRI